MNDIRCAAALKKIIYVLRNESHALAAPSTLPARESAMSTIGSSPLNFP
jgi:hypothetical protein